MIGSLRGLVALGALALALLALAVFDGSPSAHDRAILPGFDTARLADIAWRLGDREVHVAKLNTTPPRWIWIDPPGPEGTVDPDAIDRLVTALRGGRWQRRRGASAAGALRAELALSTLQGAPTRLAVGQPLAGTDQAWLVVDGDALLVDGWIANALAPDPLALRVRRPLDGALRGPLTIRTYRDPGKAPDDAIALDGVTLRLAADRTLRIAPEVRARLESALANVEIATLPRVPPPPAPGAPLELDTATMIVREAGTCTPELVLLATSAGGGCVPSTAWGAVLASVAELRGPPEAIVDRRPAAGAKRVVLADRTAIELVRIGASFDPARVAELAAALAAPAEITTGTAKPLGALEVDGAAMTLFDDGSIARASESLRLLPDVAARQVLRASGETFREPHLWLEEPTTIAAIEIDGKSFARGATLGAWTSGDAKALEALAFALASPTSLGPAAPFAEHAHAIAIRIRRPDGGELHHELALASDCRGASDGRTVRLTATLCALVERAR